MELEELKKDFEEAQKAHNDVVTFSLIAFLVIGCLLTISIINKLSWITILILVIFSVEVWIKTLKANEMLYELENMLVASIKIKDEEE